MITLDEVYDFGKIDRDRTADEAMLEAARLSGISTVKQITGRSFEKVTTATARKFVPTSQLHAWVHDIWSTTDLVVKTDEGGDGTFGTTWAASDYELHPLDGILQGETVPYFRLEAVGSRYFPVANQRTASLQVTAMWGWSAVPEPVRLAALILAASDEKVRDLVRGEGGFTKWSREHAVELLTPYIHPARRFGIA
jgi:hypothetical protein